MTNVKIKGIFKVWNNAFGSDCDVSLAIVNDMESLFAKVTEGLMILERYKLKAVRMDFHPDVWVGSQVNANLRGLVVTETTFSLEHTGYVGTDEMGITATVTAVSDLRAGGESTYSPEFEAGELCEFMQEIGI